MIARQKSWIRKDFHVHESHSSDAPEATVERYCREAERRGIDEICFTTHFITWGPDIKHGISFEDIPEYLEEIQEAQETTSVKLRTGLEVDYFPSEERRLDRLLGEYPLDMVLGSLHYVKGIDIGSRRQSPKFFRGKSVESALDTYYEELRKAVESGLFDVVAHPDYFRKYLVVNPTTQEFKPITWDQYGRKVLDAIDSLKSHDVGVEVNASGIRHGIEDVYPIQGFMETAGANGVEKVTVGSDCHRTEDLGLNTSTCLELLERVGYRHVHTFEGRKSRKLSLSDLASPVMKDG